MLDSMIIYSRDRDGPVYRPRLMHMRMRHQNKLRELAGQRLELEINMASFLGWEYNYHLAHTEQVSYNFAIYPPNVCPAKRMAKPVAVILEYKGAVHHQLHTSLFRFSQILYTMYQTSSLSRPMYHLEPSQLELIQSPTHKPLFSPHAPSTHQYQQRT